MAWFFQLSPPQRNASGKITKTVKRHNSPAIKRNRSASTRGFDFASRLTPWIRALTGFRLFPLRIRFIYQSERRRTTGRLTQRVNRIIVSLKTRIKHGYVFEKQRDAQQKHCVHSHIGQQGATRASPALTRLISQ